MGWYTAHYALVVAARWLPAVEPTRVLGMHEIRARSVRWVPEEAERARNVRWVSEEADDAKVGPVWRRRGDPWLRSFVNADPTTP